MNSVEILVGDSHGVYVPQVFAEKFDLSLWNGIDPEDAKTIAEGPEAEWYWEAWDNILSSASYKHDGNEWFLYQNGDLFAYSPNLMTDEEYENFFGEPRDV